MGVSKISHIFSVDFSFEFLLGKRQEILDASLKDLKRWFYVGEILPNKIPIWMWDIHQVVQKFKIILPLEYHQP